jgi:Uri superfamily endonuclease
MKANVSIDVVFKFPKYIEYDVISSSKYHPFIMYKHLNKKFYSFARITEEGAYYSIGACDGNSNVMRVFDDQVNTIWEGEYLPNEYESFTFILAKRMMELGHI